LAAFDLIELARQGTVHFMGIGGAGMAPLAELILRSGGRVSGCDAQAGSVVATLSGHGATIHLGHDAAHVAESVALVVTSAVPADHPEVRAAREAGIPVVKRAEALGSIVNRGTVIGIAGTHGKTSTTALTTAALAAAGFDPTGLVGGRVPAWGGNLRLGHSPYYVVEADEYDRSFLTLRPKIAVVTTLEADHLDTYGNLRGVEDAFLEFVEHVPDDGTVIGCAEDSGVGRLFPRMRNRPDRVISYGTSAGSALRIEDVRAHGHETRFVLRLHGRAMGEVGLRVPGMHNVRNAAAAVAVSLQLGGRWSDIVAGLAEYAGVDRRFQEIGQAAGVRVIDDYAHHPTELAATLHAARAGFPGARIVAVFQPHLYTRTRDFHAEFGRALALADRVYVTEVFAAREAPIEGVDGALVADAARRAGANVTLIENRAEVAATVVEGLRPGDLCLTLGAGDLNAAATEMVEMLRGAGVPA
jgi:UDP-N-acetylmuramate--alanine ligase